MKKMTVLLPLAAFVMFAGPALATEVTCGIVSSANPSTGDLRLQDGSKFRVSYPTLLKGVGPGDPVVVTLNNDNTVGITDDNRFSSPQDGGPGPCFQP